MRTRVLLCLFYMAFVTGAYAGDKNENVLKNILAGWPGLFDTILNHKAAYRLQIAYTQVNRDEHNSPTFKTYTLDVDSYFYYCASTIKLLEIPLAIEKVNLLKDRHLSIYDSLHIPEFYCSGLNDFLLRRRYLNSSIAQFAKEMLLVSNNESFNPLYDFLTPEYFNKRLKELGVKSAAICGRFAPCDTLENRQSNPVQFYDRTTKQLKYQQPSTMSPVTVTYTQQFKPLVGNAYLTGTGAVINKPKDFSTSNYVKLSELHAWNIRLQFPQVQAKDKKLLLSESDYAFIRKYMGMLPRESAYPRYSAAEYPDNLMKYFVTLDDRGKMPEQLRVFNKVGMAYGFVTDCAYVVDTLNKVEFFLTASIYVNKDGILNDGIYEYDQVALPFMRHLFAAVYLYEVNRPRKHWPKFARWDFSDNVR